MTEPEGTGTKRLGGLLLALLLGFLVFAFLRGRWPFRDRAIGDCAASGDVAYCLEHKYGWSERDALVEALYYRVNR